VALAINSKTTIVMHCKQTTAVVQNAAILLHAVMMHLY